MAEEYDELADALTDFLLRTPPGQRTEPLMQMMEVILDKAEITGDQRQQALEQIREVVETIDAEDDY